MLRQQKHAQAAYINQSINPATPNIVCAQQIHTSMCIKIQHRLYSTECCMLLTVGFEQTLTISKGSSRNFSYRFPIFLLHAHLNIGGSWGMLPRKMMLWVTIYVVSECENFHQKSLKLTL